MVKKSKIKYKRILLTTVLFTVSVLIVVSLINFSLLYFVFPYEFANFCYSVGFDNVSANLYYKDYLKSKNINTCYKVLNLKIKCSDYDMIVEIYEEFSTHQDYEEFIFKINEINEMYDKNILDQSVILNEDEFLNKEYIKALNVLDAKKAFEEGVRLFYDKSEMTLKNNGTYVLDVFIKPNENKSQFIEVYQGDNNLIIDMQSYYNSLVEIFNENKTVDTNTEKAYLVALGNKIITVGNNINAIYSELNINENLENLNNESMFNVNHNIKQILTEG